MTPKALEDVFKTVGLPPYTYVKPSYYGEIRADIVQAGKHLLIEGPSGIGKTCVVFKVFEDLGWAKDKGFAYDTARDSGALERINRFLKDSIDGATPQPSVLVMDDFHLFTSKDRARIGSDLKWISDLAFEQPSPPKIVLIGIPTTGTSLLSEAYDLGPRLGVYRFSKATDREIDRLISEGETALNVLFEDRDIVLAESAGNFWLAQYICSKVCATQEVFQSQPDVQILTFDLLGIRQRLMTELSQRYTSMAKTFAKGKRWRPGGNKPYLDVLLVLAKEPDSVVTYDRIIHAVPERRRPGLKAIRSRIPEVIFDPAKNVDLRKQIAFDSESGFSIEDPLFRYYLSNLEAASLYRELGVEPSRVENARIYSYDVGFSFAGETRGIVEVVNSALKAEDVVTFYDFDQQAFLLALDLEQALQKIYSESCRFYLVFLDEHYSRKVWANTRRTS